MKASGRPWVSLLIWSLPIMGCGGETPISPSPSPAPAPSPSPAPTLPAAPPTPAPATWSGTVTDTITGATIANFTATPNGTRVTVSAPGYVTRDTQASVTTIDLIPEAGLDLPFYRQFARNGLDGAIRPLSVLPQAPAFYVETEGAKGLPRSLVAELEKQARALVPLLTGGRFQMTRWETGPTPRPPEPGWIVIDRYYQDDACGRGALGALAGHIWLNIDMRGCVAGMKSLFAHELGHAFGFGHVDRVGSMMFAGWDHPSATDVPTDLERRMALIAYRRPRGNTDVDVDP